uniref:Uncharacterized protein n=1 Tax=Arundo donax TaxID=35708 RepID=A0A0A9BJT0_ARUDO
MANIQFFSFTSYLMSKIVAYFVGKDWFGIQHGFLETLIMLAQL